MKTKPTIQLRYKTNLAALGYQFSGQVFQQKADNSSKRVETSTLFCADSQHITNNHVSPPVHRTSPFDNVRRPVPSVDLGRLCAHSILSLSNRRKWPGRVTYLQPTSNKPTMLAQRETTANKFFWLRFGRNRWLQFRRRQPVASSRFFGIRKNLCQVDWPIVTVWFSFA